MQEKERELIAAIIGEKRTEMDEKLIRFDGNKTLLIMSNIKRFLILPR